MAWRFEGSWVVLVSGTAVGLSLIAWSLRRARQQHRPRDVVEVLQRQRVMAPEKPQQPTEQQPALTITEPAAEVAETDLEPQDTWGGQSCSSTTVSPRPSSENAGEHPLPEYAYSDPGRQPEVSCAPLLAPAPQNTDEVEGLLFAIEAKMYELKAEAEDLPIVQIRRRPRHRPVDEQLLLWPDADDPPVGADQPADITAT